MSCASRERSIPVVLGVAAAMILLAARAKAQEDYTQDEYRALPRVCLAQTFINRALQSPVVSEAERRQWAERLGESDYQHFHHFCWALIDMRRAVTTQQSEHYYRSAVNNFSYVERNVTRRFPMLPEVYLRKGMALLYLADPGAAAQSFLQATRLKPDYTPAYAALIDVYIDLGDIESAQGVLTNGIANAPGSDLLASKKIEIDRIIKSRQ